MSWNSAITAIDRYVKGRVEVYRASTLLYTFMPNDYLKSIEIGTSPVKEFFGYSISKQATITLIDKEAEIAIQEGDILKCYLGVEDEGDILYYQYPDIFVSKVDRKINGVDLVVVGYDLIERAKQYYVKDLKIILPISIESYFNAVCAALGVSGRYSEVRPSFTLTELPNFGEEATLRDALDHIAGAQGCICFMSGAEVVMKALSANNRYDIGKSAYFNLTTGIPLTLESVISRTSLEDNVQSGEGVAQILMDNAFIANRSDIGTVLDNLRYAVDGLMIYPYTLSWRGNPQLELGDYIGLQLKDGTYIPTFYLSETIKYSGGMKANSEFELTYEDTLHTNSTTIGERLNETIAKIDKVNKTIELRVQEAIEDDATIAELKLSVGQIQGTVADLEGDVIAQQTQITQTANSITAEAQARSEEDAELRSLISQQADSITLQVKEDIRDEFADDYYTKQSSVAITSNGIDISSTGSINLASGATFTVDATNFKVSESGYLTASGASLPSASATNLTVYDELSFKDSGGTETIEVDCSTRYNGRVSMGGGNLNLYGVDTGIVISSNGGRFQIMTRSDGLSQITLNGTSITDFSAITGEAVFG